MSRKRKKCYTISVGKLNPAKLANFMEIECFVIVACPENSIVESKVSQPTLVNGELSSQFTHTLSGILQTYRHTIRARDCVTARAKLDGTICARLWQTLDRGYAGVRLRCLCGLSLRFSGKGKVSDIEDLDDNKPVFSLVTGTYRHPKQFGGPYRSVSYEDMTYQEFCIDRILSCRRANHLGRHPAKFRKCDDADVRECSWYDFRFSL
jgi:diphthamide biosynthesis protein 2